MERICLSTCFCFMQLWNSSAASVFETLGGFMSSGKVYNEAFCEHRIGRFAIDIPAEATLHYRKDRFDGIDITVVDWDRSMAIHTAFEQEWEQRLAEIKSMDLPEHADAVLVKECRFNEPQGEMRAVLYYGNTIHDDQLYWDLLLKTDKELVWFKDYGMQEFYPHVLEDMKDLARIYSNNVDEPFDNGLPWYYLDRGILKVPFKEEEKSELRFNKHALFNEFEIQVKTNHIPEKSKSLIKGLYWHERISYLLGGLFIRKLRVSKRSLAGMDGEEMILLMKERGKSAVINFTWSYRGKKTSMDHPEITIEMNADDSNRKKTIVLWDQILDSLHYLGARQKENNTHASSADTHMAQWSHTTTTGLVIYRKNHTYGLRDAEGREILKPEYHYIGEFQDDMLIVGKIKNKEQYMGLLDRHGRAITPLRYRRIGFFKDGLSIVQKKQEGLYVFAVIDLAGREVTHEDYSWIEPFQNGIAKVQSEEGRSFINRRGELISGGTWYEYVNNFSEGRAVVHSSKHCWVIDEQGKNIIPPGYLQVGEFKEGYAVVHKNEYKYGYINKDGQQITPIKYDYAEKFSQGVALVKEGSSYGLVDTTGREIIPPIFDGKELNREGVPLLFSVGGRYGAVDLSGNPVIPFFYHQLFRYGKNMIRAINDDLSGVIDENGNVVVPLEYQSIRLMKNGLLKAGKQYPHKKNECYGVIGQDGRILIDIEYDEVEEFRESGHDLICVTRQNKYGLYDLNGNIVLHACYDYMRAIDDKHILVLGDKGFGIFNRDGHIIVPLKCESDFRIFNHGDLIRVCSEGKYGFYKKNIPVIPLQYDYIYHHNTGHFVFKKGNQWGLLSPSGKEIGHARYQYTGEYHCGVVRAKLNGLWGYLDENGKTIIPFRYDYASDFIAGKAYVKDNKHKQWMLIELPGMGKACTALFSGAEKDYLPQSKASSICQVGLSGITFKDDEIIALFQNGSIREGILAQKTAITLANNQTILLKGQTFITCYLSGNLCSVMPAQDVSCEIVGHAIEFNKGKRLCFYENGQIKSGIMSNDSLLKVGDAELTFQKHTVVSFFDNGNVRSGKILNPIPVVINGRQVTLHTQMLHFGLDGQLEITETAYKYEEGWRSGEIAPVFEVWLNKDAPDLITAARDGHTSKVRDALLLLVNVNIMDSEGNTPLMLAAYNGHDDIVKLLIEANADINAKNVNSITALMMAAFHGHDRAAYRILAKVTDVDARDRKGNTALIYAAEGGNNKIVDHLIVRKAELNASENQGLTALMVAATEGHTGVAWHLIKAGADIDKKDLSGRTAYTHAIQNSQPEIVRLLMKKDDTRSMVDIGMLYYNDKKQGKNLFKAVGWFTKASKLGNSRAQTMLGTLCATGEGVRKNTKRGIKLLENGAAQGDSLALYNLGALCEETDIARAVEYYQKAAKLGQPNAQLRLGLMYQEGKDLPRDAARAFELYQQPAEQGDCQAQHHLALLYYFGDGVDRNLSEALKFFEKAALQGVVEAQHNAGIMYYKGESVPKDNIKAYIWFEKAACAGFAESQYQFGALYHNGQGVPKDLVIAYAWFDIAARQGNQDAIDWCSRLKETLTQDELDEAESLSSSWQPGQIIER